MREMPVKKGQVWAYAGMADRHVQIEKVGDSHVWVCGIDGYPLKPQRVTRDFFDGHFMSVGDAAPSPKEPPDYGVRVGQRYPALNGLVRVVDEIRDGFAYFVWEESGRTSIDLSLSRVRSLGPPLPGGPTVPCMDKDGPLIGLPKKLPPPEPARVFAAQPGFGVVASLWRGW